MNLAMPMRSTLGAACTVVKDSRVTATPSNKDAVVIATVDDVIATRVGKRERLRTQWKWGEMRQTLGLYALGCLQRWSCVLDVPWRTSIFSRHPFYAYLSSWRMYRDWSWNSDRVDDSLSLSRSLSLIVTIKLRLVSDVLQIFIFIRDVLFLCRGFIVPPSLAVCIDLYYPVTG